MTNEEIARKYLSDIVSELTPDKQRVKVFDKAMTQARKSERAKVIEEIERFIHAGVTMTLLRKEEVYPIQSKLNQLKGEG